MGKIQQRARKLGGGVAAIERAYRDLVKAAHPDVGGDANEFRALTSARDSLIVETDCGPLWTLDLYGSHE
jgi:hypothetical protein